MVSANLSILLLGLAAARQLSGSADLKLIYVDGVDPSTIFATTFTRRLQQNLDLESWVGAISCVIALKTPPTLLKGFVSSN